MHEPAAWGALPAQQANAQSGPLAAAGQAMLPATKVSNSVTARNALAATVTPRPKNPDFLESGLCFTMSLTIYKLRIELQENSSMLATIMQQVGSVLI
jgi:hypothetical protein